MKAINCLYGIFVVSFFSVSASYAEYNEFDDDESSQENTALPGSSYKNFALPQVDPFLCQKAALLDR